MVEAGHPQSAIRRGASFGGHLRSLREQAGLSQEELAERAEMSSDAVSSLERGTRRHPYPATVRALADALQLTPHERAALLAAVPKRRTPGRRRQPSGSAPGALPVSSTPPLGREQDVAAVRELLASSVRLVTLTGTGGIGKSRLAVAVASVVSGDRQDGAAFVPLAAVRDQSLVLPEIARAAAANPDDGLGGREIFDALSPLELLLVLDNLEHLLDAAPAVSALLASCPGITVLATSRAPLRIRGEVEYAVRPLPLPHPDTTDVAGLVASPAASLLIERGRAVRREFTVGPGDVPAVVGICHRLAGLPLALELAAPGLRMLQPAALLAHLDEVLAQGGPVDLPARQHTMRATLDWSYGLLDHDTRTAYRRASVFVGGFTWEAAEAVLGVADVLEAVARLTGQSLLATTASDGGTLRYAMLEPVAEYARSLLHGPEEDAARLAHAEHFVEEAQRAELSLHRGEQVEALAWYDAEEGNAWSALEWSLRTARADLAGRLTWALYVFWWVRGRRDRGRRIVDQVLALDLADPLRARVLHTAAALPEPGTLPPEDVEALYLRSVELAERCGDHGVVAASAIGAGLIALGRADHATAEQRLRRGLDAATKSEEYGGWNAGLAHTWLAAARRFQGDPLDAVEHGRRAVGSASGRGDMLSHSIALYELGQAELALGRHRTAREHLVEAVTLCQRTRDAGNLSYILDALAGVELRTGGRERVGTLLGAAEALREAVGSSVYLWYVADLELRERDADQARRDMGDAAYERAVAAGRSLTLDGAAEFARRGSSVDG